MSLDPSTILVAALDVCGTVVKPSVPREEIVGYVDAFEAEPPVPFTVPESWGKLPAWPDAAEGLRRLRSRFRVVTCSNVPVATLRAMSGHNGLVWDGYVDVAASGVYKPHPQAYRYTADVLRVPAHRVLMVTANPKLGRRDYGDVEAAREVGMQSVLIRGESEIPDIIALAERLGC